MKSPKYNFLLLSGVVGLAGNFFITPDVVQEFTDPENYKIKKIILGYSYIIRGAVALNNPRLAVQINGVNLYQLPNPQFNTNQIQVGFWGANNEINFEGLQIQGSIRWASLNQNDAGYLVGDQIENYILVEWEYSSKSMQ